MNFIGSKAKPTVEAIARFCEREGIAYKFLPAKGRHPSVEMTLNRRSRRVFFAGSPSDRRVIANVLQSVRKEARELGWRPAKVKENEMGFIGSTASKWAAQKPSEGPASVATIERPIPDSCPRPPVGMEGKQIPGGAHGNARLTAAIHKRNAYAFARRSNGDKSADIYSDICAAGWVVKSPANIDAMVSQHRKTAGLAMKRKHVRERIAPAPKVEITHTPTPKVSALALEIAVLIEPVIKAKLAGYEQIKAKADKWDAMADLVRDA